MEKTNRKVIYILVSILILAVATVVVLYFYKGGFDFLNKNQKISKNESSREIKEREVDSNYTVKKSEKKGSLKNEKQISKEKKEIKVKDKNKKDNEKLTKDGCRIIEMEKGVLYILREEYIVGHTYDDYFYSALGEKYKDSVEYYNNECFVLKQGEQKIDVQAMGRDFLKILSIRNNKIKEMKVEDLKVSMKDILKYAYRDCVKTFDEYNCGNYNYEYFTKLSETDLYKYVISNDYVDFIDQFEYEKAREIENSDKSIEYILENTKGGKINKDENLEFVNIKNPKEKIVLERDDSIGVWNDYIFYSNSEFAGAYDTKFRKNIFKNLDQYNVKELKPIGYPGKEKYIIFNSNDSYGDNAETYSKLSVYNIEKNIFKDIQTIHYFTFYGIKEVDSDTFVVAAYVGVPYEIKIGDYAFRAYSGGRNVEYLKFDLRKFKFD
ncbi:hypothetical protein CSB11_02350 [Candidatus Campbellbacteria bacterium]|nr:MAG: hypothetical protein CSB11_02350 [Candidatus Campbellbacteria bacterium]